jgi:hypothetical protein
MMFELGAEPDDTLLAAFAVSDQEGGPAIVSPDITATQVGYLANP